MWEGREEERGKGGRRNFPSGLLLLPYMPLRHSPQIGFCSTPFSACPLSPLRSPHSPPKVSPKSPPPPSFPLIRSSAS